MKLAIISPNSLLERYSQTDYHLVLPDMLKDPEYERFYHDVAKGWKVLDNGAHEEGTRSPGELFYTATILAVDEIVVPDVIRDKSTTLALINSFARYAHQHPEYKYMGVVQGSTVPEAWACLHDMMNINYLNSIGIPQHLCSLDQHIRVEMADLIDEWIGLQVHLLGNNSRWPKEVREAASLSCVVGHDTTYPVKLGLRGYYIDHNPPYIPRDSDYFEFTNSIVRSQDATIKENIRIYQGWCNGQ